jgi:hypothetical protein
MPVEQILDRVAADAELDHVEYSNETKPLSDLARYVSRASDVAVRNRAWEAYTAARGSSPPSSATAAICA